MKFQSNSYIFIQENQFENVVWKMAAILSRLQCAKIKDKDKFYLKSGTSTTNNISSMSYCPTVK